MHPLMLQQLATDHVSEMFAAARDLRRARYARHTLDGRSLDTTVEVR